MGPLLQFLNNLFMICLLHTIIATVAFLIAMAIRRSGTREAIGILDSINRIIDPFNIYLRIVIIPICAVLIEILSYTVPDWLFALLGGVLLFGPIIFSVSVGLSLEHRHHRRGSSQE